ncbi:MAG TPA: ATP phosphoribosyltransferase [Archaeoglobus profundus]|nr:ATP phosphoribosyltransferase [Archaeoglobus profundus]
MIIAIPNKGRLSQPAIDLLIQAGIKPEFEERKLIVPTNNPNISILYARARDIPEYVYMNAAQAGITGYDMVLESGVDVDILLKLGFGKAKLVVAVPAYSEIKSIEDLDGKRVATEFKRITENFFKKKGIDVEVVKISGACENAPYIGIADAIVDLTSTGTTLRVNNLRVIETILETEAVLIANKKVRDCFEIKALVTSIKGVLNAKGMMYLMMNVPGNVLDEVKKIVPGLKGPTVMKILSNEDLFAVHVVVHEDKLFEVLEKLKKVGARDILIIPIQRLVF